MEKKCAKSEAARSDYQTQRYYDQRERVEEEVPEKDRRLILEFDDDLTADGISSGRRGLYLQQLRSIRKIIGKSLEDVTKGDIKKFLAKKRREGLAEATINNYQVSFKKFYKWLWGDGERYPDLVSWINTTPKNKHQLPRDSLLSEDDIEKLVKACNNNRDRAIILVLAESGVRAGELLDMKIGHVRFDKYGALVTVRGKTGDRTVRLIASSPALSSWLEDHPDRENSEAPLWINIGVKNHGESMTYGGLQSLIRVLTSRAGLKKKVHAHAFRHSAATRLAKSLTEAELKQYFGWVQSSQMASRYVHLASRDVDRSLLKLHGIIESEEDREELTVIECPRCRARNSPTSDFCSKCSLPLSREAVEEEREAREKLERILEGRSAEVEALESLIEKIIEEKLEA